MASYSNVGGFLTIKEHFGKLEGLTLAYVGDGRNNVANSLLITSAILGVNISIVTPKSLFPESDLIVMAEKYAEASQSKVFITDDIDQGVAQTDIIYTDVWVSMGEESAFKERIDLLLPYQVNQELMLKRKRRKRFSYIAYQPFMILKQKLQKKLKRSTG